MHRPVISITFCPSRDGIVTMQDLKFLTEELNDEFEPNLTYDPSDHSNRIATFISKNLLPEDKLSEVAVKIYGLFTTIMEEKCKLN